MSKRSEDIRGTRMINLMVPNKFDLWLLEEYQKLNANYSEICINEQFGSIPNIEPIGSSREKSRLPSLTKEKLEEYIDQSNEYDIKIAWTINSACFGSLYDLKFKYDSFVEAIKYLEHIGVYRIICAHPLLAKIIKDETNLKVEISTITHVESLDQIDEIIKLGVDKVNVSLNMNRNYRFLKAASKLPIEIELLATEMCNLYCLHRRFHYALQSHQEESEKDLFNNYPYSVCSGLKCREAVNWIKSPWILPQDMCKYKKAFNINNFKITGRTFPSRSILNIVEKYMKQEYHGNLLNLWTHLENIGKEESEFTQSSIYIDSKELDKFIDFFLDEKNQNLDCRLCSNQYCRHCYKYLYKSLK